MNNVISISEVRAKLPKLVSIANDLSKKTYITVRGKIKAAIISARELELMEETLEVLSDSKLMKAIKEGKEDVKRGRLVDWEDIKKELDL